MWSPQQERALDAVGEWLQSGNEQVFRLFGYAGTGKTTLAKHLAESAGVVQFGAFTGKAAHVLKQKGCTNAKTIHSMIYLPKGKSEHRLRDLEAQLEQTSDPKTRTELEARIQAEKSSLKRPSFVLDEDSSIRDVDLIVIDECSMVDERMARDLMSFGVKILVLGDPAQLPPVRGTGYFTSAEPDFLLTEVHRQAKDNPVLALATAVREGKSLKAGVYGSSIITRELDPDMAMSADQILVGRNVTRHKVNDRIRELRRHESETPEVGERLVCLRNNHDEGLLNGSIWHVDKNYGSEDPVLLDLRPDGEDLVQPVLMHRRVFTREELEWYEKLESNEFDFGYALTVHKSQGSQWDNVMIIDESHVFRGSSRQWLYTAITRAAKSVVIKV